MAEAVNRILDELYPDENLRPLYVTRQWVGFMERGQNHWPRKHRRAALRRLFDVATDAELGLYVSQSTGPLHSDDETAPETGLGASGQPTRPAAMTRTAPANAHGSPAIDATRPNAARRYNYWLGGKDNFAPDRESGNMIADVFPSVIQAARQNRAFLHRMVRYLAAECGVRQFLDIGAGLPTPDNTHEIAQKVSPEARVLYVDNDPLVMVHARALMISDQVGCTGYLEADVRDPASLLRDPIFTRTLDLDQPVAVLLVAVLHFLPDDDQTADIVRQLVDALAPGSFLVISHATLDHQDGDAVARFEAMSAAGEIDVRPRPEHLIRGYFEGLDLVAPGIVSIADWRPGNDDERPSPGDIAMYGAVGTRSKAVSAG
ncbi:SAM-dependent methyltransferase [Actinoplanes sp. GCM10030250]|uniref:SAM-dependent methyltransferase n=1 Tax=Actinoplanes sp. GCM10030250 TaxID=3273376 RepID=UPI00361C2583